MRRYWLDPSLLVNAGFEISGDVFQHIFVVCRQDLGSRFEVLTGDQKAYLVEVTERSKKSARAQIVSVRDIEPLPKPHIHLYLSLCKYPVMDSVIERAVELGVHSIHLFYSDFSFLQRDLPAAKLERWEKIVLSATQQSGRGDRMQILAPRPLVKILTAETNPKPGVLSLFPYEGRGTALREQLRDERAKQSTSIQELRVFLGSEGGFSDAEVERFRAAGIPPVTLGAQVLRVETAGLALVSVLKYEFEIMR